MHSPSWRLPLSLTGRLGRGRRQRRSGETGRFRRARLPRKPDGRKADDAAKTDRSLREQEIYIPYEKLRGVFEKHGRGVFLPYEKFDELWKAAQDKTRPAAEARPPVGAVITEIENEAVVAKDVVQVTAHVKIDLLSEGWHEVPLRLADAAVVRATINERAGPAAGRRQ